MTKEKSAIEKKFDSALAKSFATPHALANEYLNKHIIGGQSIGLRRERVFDPNDQNDLQWLKETFRQRLLQETQKTLETNYDTNTIFHITETLLNFQIPILIADKSIELSKKIDKDMLTFKKNLSKAIKDLDSLLDNELFRYDECFKVGLLIQKKALEKIQNEMIKTVKADEAVLTKLYDVFLDPFGNFPDYFRYNEEHWLRKYEKLCLLLNLGQQKGRPYKIFWKALQVIIYKLLTDTHPKTKTHYVQWAKELTASIINEFFKDWKWETLCSYPEDTSMYSATLIYKEFGSWYLPILKTKDIDNALHSSV